MRFLGWLAVFVAMSAGGFFIWVEYDHLVNGPKRAAEQARQDAQRAREYYLRRVETPLSQVKKLEGGCIGWLDLFHCEYSFRSPGEIRLKDARRYSRVDCAEVSGPLETLGYEDAAVKRLECRQTDDSGPKPAGERTTVYGYARDKERGVHLLWEVY